MKMIKLLIIAFALSVFSTSAIAQDDYDFYLQKARQRIAEGDCSRAETSYNTYKEMTKKTDKDIERFIRECKEGSQSGNSAEVQLAEGKYTGEMANGKPHGKGIIYFKTEDNLKRVSYDGDWVNGIKTGKGIMIWKDGNKYIGQFKDDKLNGQGSFFFFDGGKYEGLWKDSQRNGQGSYHYPDGSKYEGQWKDGQRNGEGTIFFSNGNKYKGQWKDDLMNGQGVFYWKEGDYDHGGYVNGEKEGVFIRTKTNGKKYKATYHNDVMVEDWQEDAVEGIGEGLTFIVNDISFVMKRVEGGTFQMGSNEIGDADRCRPVHDVTLNSFYMGETETTQALWKAVMGTEPTNHGGWSEEYGRGRNYPAYQVSWNDVQIFIRKLNQLTCKNFRMPTEAEWEYAARGGILTNGFKYAGSNMIDNVGWYHGNLGGKTEIQEVKRKAPNELGLYDMSGNVREWCQDWYGGDYYGKSPLSNPQGPLSGVNRVVRGGGGKNCADSGCTVWSRIGVDPNSSYHYGFRLVLSDNDELKVNYNNQFQIGVFSVAPDRKVNFAPGNLQYQASTNTWRFAPNPWDVIGKDNENISPTYKGWIDLFGWGTGNEPTKSTEKDKKYTSFSDWGTEYGDGWRTLTEDEWKYLIDNRNTNSGLRFAKATVNGVKGIILFPDNWDKSIYNISCENDKSSTFWGNEISASTWSSIFSSAGAVFLPSAGVRSKNSIYYVNESGYYWSASKCPETKAFIGSGSLEFQWHWVLVGSSHSHLGFSVRLVRPAN